MNKDDDELNDEMLGELLLPLRAVGPPEEIRRANREAVASAVERRVKPVWWRRTVAVPVPLAIAATLAIVAGTVVLVASPRSKQSAGGGVTVPERPAVVAGDSVRGVAPHDDGASNWSVKRSYVRSLESLARGTVDFDSQEKRDDS